MMLTELICAQAALLAGQLDERQNNLLRLLCQAAATGLENRLKPGLTPEDCKADFVAAASMYALAALNEAGQAASVAEFRAGDLTVRRSGMDMASRCLQRQADLIIHPYVQDGFSFQGV
ncbi:MAG: hypothetical protein IJE81_05565 [Oscillospiraceae bacterium]|nr:hypothetical protein [Oscillospiraceae bacterium]